MDKELGKIRGIKYVSFVEKSGYGITADRNIRALIKMGIPLTWAPMVHGQKGKFWYAPFEGKSIPDSEFNSICNKEIDYNVVIVNTVPEYFPMWKLREPDKFLVGAVTWETDKIPDSWHDPMNSMNVLAAPCKFNKEVYESCGIEKPTIVFPYLLNNDKAEAGNLTAEINETDFVFYTINVWSVRKAIGLTVKSYLDTFTSKDNVTLVIKTTLEDSTHPRFWNLYRDTKTTLNKIVSKYLAPAKIVLINEELDDSEIEALHKRGNCYVSLCRSEGWGMGAYDAAVSGNPVIMTGYGGQLDFLPPELSYLVDYKLINVIDPVTPHLYSTNQKWADADTVSASKQMKHVFENRQEAAEKGEKLKKYIIENFNEEKLIVEFLNSIEQLL